MNGSETLPGTDITGFQTSIPGVYVLNSKGGGGKSHLIRYIMYCLQSIFAWGLVFSHSIFNTENFDYIPDAFKHTRYTKEPLLALLNLQSSFPQEGRPPAFVIFDDCISEKKMWNCPVLFDTVTQCRQYNLVVIISTQHINKVIPAIRENAFQVFIFYAISKNNLEAAYESYGQDFHNYNTFKNFIQQATNPIVNNNTIRGKFAYKDEVNGGVWRVLRAPPEIPKFMLEYAQIIPAGSTLPRKRKSDNQPGINKHKTKIKNKRSTIV